jgi:hypothetical protein
MKKSLICLFFLVLFVSGCNNGNFSPRLKQNNTNGEISNNQNGFMLELGKIKKDTEILSSKLREIQEGLVNINAAVSRNENTGVQILQGDGSLILVFALSVVAFLFYYKNKNSQEVAKILTKKIIDTQDMQLMSSVVEELSDKKKDAEFLSVLRRLG